MIDKILEEGGRRLWEQLLETAAMTMAATVAAGAGAAIWGAIEDTIFGVEDEKVECGCAAKVVADEEGEVGGVGPDDSVDGPGDDPEGEEEGGETGDEVP